MKTFFPYIVFIFLLSSITFLIGRSFRVGQVPNGNKFDCNTCHTNGGGTARNPFGLTIQNQFLTSVGPNGNVEWGPQLAAIDSDGDGFSNGEELGDPNGTWQQGQPNPGNSADITHPGNANDFPTSVEVVSTNPVSYQLFNNYPNPFNPSTTISFNIPEAGNVRIDIYNSVGELVKTLVNDFYNPGQYKTAWNGTDVFGSTVASGLYIYRMTSQNYIHSKRMLLIK